MSNVLTSVDIGRVERIMQIYWNLPPEKRKEFDEYENEHGCGSVVDCMEEYFGNNGFK